MQYRTFDCHVLPRNFLINNLGFPKSQGWEKQGGTETIYYIERASQIMNMTVKGLIFVCWGSSQWIQNIIINYFSKLYKQRKYFDGRGNHSIYLYN